MNSEEVRAKLREHGMRQVIREIHRQTIERFAVGRDEDVSTFQWCQIPYVEPSEDLELIVPKDAPFTLDSELLARIQPAWQHRMPVSFAPGESERLPFWVGWDREYRVAIIAVGDTSIEETES